MSDHYPVEVLMRFSYRKSASKREISTSHQTSASYVTSSTRRHLICALALLAIQTRSLAVAERPRDAAMSLKILLTHSRSF